MSEYAIDMLFLCYCWCGLAYLSSHLPHVYSFW